MQINPFKKPIEDAVAEAYSYFDENIRHLPKDQNGRIDMNSPGFNDNDVDAFRHAYVSGIFTQDYSERVANLLGLMNEFSPEGILSRALDPRSTNMDLWNNRVGRKYGKKTRGRKTLLKLIHGALKNGELITTPDDPREYLGQNKIPRRISKPVIALSQTSSGRNEVYYDLKKRTPMTREEFIALIHAGEYRGYTVKSIRKVETPVSKRDGRKINNIG